MKTSQAHFKLSLCRSFSFSSLQNILIKYLFSLEEIKPLPENRRGLTLNHLPYFKEEAHKTVFIPLQINSPLKKKKSFGSSTLDAMTQIAVKACCRLCLAPENECVDIFKTQASDKQPIQSKINSCVQIQVSEIRLPAVQLDLEEDPFSSALVNHLKCKARGVRKNR